MITHTESSLGARYLIAQVMPDPMRRELRNVGVVVQKGHSLAARFLGENEDGQFDGRRAKMLPDPQVYRMWIRHWRKAMDRNPEEVCQTLLDKSRDTFRFISGGDVTDTGTDTADDIALYLYSMLVSGGGLSEALSNESEADSDSADLRFDLRSQMRSLKIMLSSASDSVKHPVYEDQPLRGATQWQHVTFLQRQNGQAWAIEPFNLASRMKRRIRERAGYLAFMFSDLASGSEQSGTKVNPIAVVRFDKDDSCEDARYALDVVRDHAEVVDWYDTQQRKKFLNDREAIALAN